VGTLDFLQAVASDYPLQAFRPLRLGQSFADDSATQLRGAAEPGTMDEPLRAAEKKLAERRAVAGATWGDRETVAYHNAVAHLKLARGRLESAAEHYEEALEIAPDNAVALIGLAIVRFESARQTTDAAQRDVLLGKADALLRRVDPGSAYYARAVYNRIEVALAAGDVELATSLWDTYAGLDDDPAWASRLGVDLDRAKGARTGG
jgi:tetratricopeptide (TPR) repeat protein